ncbi:MAG: hypothetical protein FWD78_06665 [Treponema sp.]|nr:hypothetical protein [Treponema sp.]
MKSKNAGLKTLAAELESLIPQLDAEGLEYLIQQARIHLYNMQVDEHNRSVIEEANKANAAKPVSKTAADKTAARTAGSSTGFTIRGTESGSSFYFHYKNNDVMFSRGEMLRLSKIVNGPGTDLEIRERLYNWFDRERRDIFALANMKDKFDERLKELVKVLKKSLVQSKK